MELNISELRKHLKNSGIEVINIRVDLKSSEKYVDVIFRQSDGFFWDGSIPFFYRRTGLFIDNEETLAEYLKGIKGYFTQKNIFDFAKQESDYWDNNMSRSDVTILFFKELAKMDWTSNFPNNDNPQRRIQDIKEKGYTLASRRVGRKAERLLVPIPRSSGTGYEFLTNTFRKRAIKTLNTINIYELSSANIHGLLPDHKFPEIRWDQNTLAENPDEMSEEEIKQKFQLLDNQRNQQKREVCRRCFQIGKRGKLFGLNFFYAGNENWSNSIPKVGKEAEAGCFGCGWYDIKKWRDTLNELLN